LLEDLPNNYSLGIYTLLYFSMKASIQYNTMNELWILSIECKQEESVKYTKLIVKIIIKILSGEVLPKKKRRIKTGKHYVIQNQVVELYHDDWFPLILVSKKKTLLEGIKFIFMDLIGVNNILDKQII